MTLITSLPLSGADRIACIERANQAFDAVVRRMEPHNPATTRLLWDADRYIDSVLENGMLPIEREYAFHLVEVALVQHVAHLAAEADGLAGATKH
jgi:hypothetical protein